MELFAHQAKEKLEQSSPLAARMRPRTLEEYVGQDHILAPGRLLHRAIKADQLSSLIFYGPPGTGKTTLASVIANTTSSRFEVLNAVLSGVKDIRAVIEEAKNARDMYQRRTILFVDEVHRWNKSQQDALLPWVENGVIILIGATTENPYFSVNKALLSRSRVFQLKPLNEQDLERIIELVLSDSRGYSNQKISIEDQALQHLVTVANGDARAIINALELAVETTPLDDTGVKQITLEVAEESIQQRAVLYDQEGDCHFDTISAFIKSLRGSDPDAALYWMAKMIYAGEDPKYIFRRMLISSVEDIGLANPNALQYVQAAADAFDRIGMPEGNFLLANAAIYLATSEKSNSALAFFDALKTVREERDSDVPNHLRDGSRDKEGFGHGAGYKYPHAYKDHWIAQQYLPDSLQGRVFYNPGKLGYEKGISDSVNRRREEQLAAMSVAEQNDVPVEILTFSPVDKEFDRWLQRTVTEASDNLRLMRETVYGKLAVQRHFRHLIVNDTTGLLTWEALRLSPEGGVWSLLENDKNAQLITDQCRAFNEDDSIALRMPEIILANESSVAQFMNENLQFEVLILNNLFDSGLISLEQLQQILFANGQISLVQTIYNQSTRLSSFINWQGFEQLEAKVKTAEAKIYLPENDSKMSITREFVIEQLRLFDSQFEFTNQQESRTITVNQKTIHNWFNEMNRNSFISRINHNLDDNEINQLKHLFVSQLANRQIIFSSTKLYATSL